MGIDVVKVAELQVTGRQGVAEAAAPLHQLLQTTLQQQHQQHRDDSHSKPVWRKNRLASQKAGTIAITKAQGTDTPQEIMNFPAKVFLAPFSRPGKVGEVPCAAKSACNLRQPPAHLNNVQQVSKESQQSLLCADIANTKNGR